MSVEEDESANTFGTSIQTTSRIMSYMTMSKANIGWQLASSNTKGRLLQKRKK
uniref:Uncharacterized protein n=1 Tax=Arundo donax TaxID=35708 RepID=A0A0A9ENH7_ARUDO